MRADALVFKFFHGEIDFQSQQEAEEIAKDVLVFMEENNLKVTDGDETIIYREKEPTDSDGDDYYLEDEGRYVHQLTDEELLTAENDYYDMVTPKDM